MLSNSAVINAANSPLILLPPETHNRIWDAAFRDLIVRVDFVGTHVNGRLGHSSTICHRSWACEAYSQQLDPAERFIRPDPAPIKCQKRKPDDPMPVHLLQVCRQIYHEAALKPFSQPTFDFVAAVSDRGMNHFLTRLVPEQARAIGHLHLSCFRDFHISKLATALFRGVNHVELEVGGPDELEVVKQKGGIEWLKEAGLKSMRFTVRVITVSTEERRAFILEWITREEDGILAKQDETMVVD